MSNSNVGYPTFDSIKDPKLRAWNRCATFFNIIQDQSRAEADEYIKQFNDFDRANIRNLTREIQEHGYTNVRKQIIESGVIH